MKFHWDRVIAKIAIFWAILGHFGPFWTKNRDYLEAGVELAKTTYTPEFPILLRFFFMSRAILDDFAPVSRNFEIRDFSAPESPKTA